MALFLLPALLLAGDGVVLGKSLLEKVAHEVLKESPEGRKILKEFDRYKRLAHIFKKYHDKGHLDDAGVLEIVRGAPGQKPSGKSAPVPAAPKPFSVQAYSGGYRWPLASGIVSSEFGHRWGKEHQGLDIAADMRVPVYAVAPGEVLYAGSQISGYGNVVILRHDQKTTSLYGHNIVLKVKTGDKVAADQVIALLGSTGHSTGPHVHFELRDSNRPISPRERLPKSRF